ncbi:unnamed protein product [Adineta ricciae]|uniref:Uncharacterized protein n=1 Tax=Adineta ricciae TaxID=249248 RepID=A0A815KQI7_ADIRI|nr:unnamed protein product [Adineta ricciae]CAF1399555.1 unnamed protein product [Adineta ricciae]
MASQRRVKSGNYLEKIYQCNRDIRECRLGALYMAKKEQERGYRINATDVQNTEQIRIRTMRLHLLQHNEIIRSYSGGVVQREVPEIPKFPDIGMPAEKKLPKPVKNNHSIRKYTSIRSKGNSDAHRPTSPVPVLKVKRVVFEKNRAVIDMKMQQTESNDVDVDDKNNIVDDIVYPPGVIDRRPYDIVAKYRRLAGKTIDFIAKPLDVGEDKAETTVLGLSSFAETHSCELIFTDEEHRFDNSIYRAACGVADLGSIHLLATDSVQTATFCFVMDFDFNSEFEGSAERVEAFVVDFCQAIATVLECNTNNVRMFSVGKIGKEKNKSEVKFGITTGETKKTEQLAKALKSRARSSFTDDKVLGRVFPSTYEYEWTTALQALRLQISDLDPTYNFDYRPHEIPSEDSRGGYTYYLPRGWYRHALRVKHKYEKDSHWLDNTNAKGEWPVAFHGTKDWAVSSIAKEGLKTTAVKTDAMRSEAIQQMGDEADRPGLYVATHCDGGASIYTEKFTVKPFPDQTETFRIVFQCRVKPEKYTVHTSPVNQGHAWRYVDPSSIRPYGILLKKEN